MAGAQPWHVGITGNVVATLHVQFRGRPGDAYFTDMRVRVQAGDLWTYPDVAALCGESRFDTSHNPDSLLNLQVIFEVLSPSSEVFDRDDQFVLCKKLESLTDCVLISAEEMRIEHHARQADGSWISRQYEQPSDVLPLTSVSAELPLAKIYERVQFPEAGIDE